MNSNSTKDTPQLENGYTMIAHELFEAIALYPFTGGELKVILIILRSTYGYKRKTTPISIKMFMEKTRLSRRYVLEVLKNLKDSRVIMVVKSGRKNIIGIGKDYTRWALWINIFPKLPESTIKVSQSSPVDDL